MKTKEEIKIMTTAIKFAIDNGWRLSTFEVGGNTDFKIYFKLNNLKKDDYPYEMAVYDFWTTSKYNGKDLKVELERLSIADILYDREFAKAIWSAKRYYRFKDDTECWKWHLQNMVIMENPLNYLEEFIDDL
jgi:hypothetical protein